MFVCKQGTPNSLSVTFYDVFEELGCGTKIDEIAMVIRLWIQ